MTTGPGFLTGRGGQIPWDLPEGTRRGVFTPRGLYLGRDPLYALEVAIATARSRPAVADIRALWRRRRGNRPAPLLLVIVYPTPMGEGVALCGPAGENPPVVVDRETGLAERIVLAALDEPNRTTASHFLTEALAEAESDLPGLRNSGMFATHELRERVPAMPEWATAESWGRAALGLRGRELVQALGFDIGDLGAAASVLRVKSSRTRTAVAVFLEDDESPDGLSGRFGGVSPISYALAQADTEQLPYVVLTRGPQIRVYSAKHRGVGRKGRDDTFVEANLILLPDHLAGYLPLLFGATALAPEGTFEAILEQSQFYSAGLGERLRDRVYEQVVPGLAKALAAHHRVGPQGVTEQELADLYETAMVILFRLLFIAYAEDKNLLPYDTNSAYQQRSLKALARDLADRKHDTPDAPFDGQATDLWDRLASLWGAVDQGHTEWGVPAYDGGMFSSDPEVSPAGGRIAILRLSNGEIGPPLQALLVDEGDAGVYGPVDFRSLSVREFGTIYEGLLESSLSVAPADLTTDREGSYIPAKKGAKVVVPGGGIYLHNRSGARKATGSYFTKSFAVEHLLDHALEPALDDHVERLRALLDAGDEHAAGEAFFDFRVADIAMGSGHFLVAAVDHIERRLSNLLVQHPIPGVLNELGRLRRTALDNLGELAAGVEIEQSTLLRRQIARRCIYGVDLNLIAVQLARLGIWIHSFVPGLPLSFLDHNLIQGDSLTGIGTVEEAEGILNLEGGEAGTMRLARDSIVEPLERAVEALGTLARVSDASAAEIRQARQAQEAARHAAEPARRLFDALVAHRLGEVDVVDELGRVVPEATDPASPTCAPIGRLVASLNAVHFPVAFPEVFLRARGGFDCIIGNPPWEEVMVDTDSFWTVRHPELRGLPPDRRNSEIARLSKTDPITQGEYTAEVAAKDRLRRCLSQGQFPDMNYGNADLYKAFAWRFWHLIREGGAIGVVLPRSALMGAGSARWRETVLDQGAFADTTLLLNRAGWVFDDAEHRYTIGLVSIRKGAEHVGLVRTRGPFRDMASFLRGVQGKPTEFPATQFVTWTTGAAFPLIPTPEAAEVFVKMREAPRFDDSVHLWRARPVQGDINATTEKDEVDFDPTSKAGMWPVYGGAAFNLWEPDTGEYYAWADPAHITSYLQSKRVRQARRVRSAFAEMPDASVRDETTLPCRRPRIAFRDVTNRTNQRTVIACLIPPEVVIVNTGPYLLFVAGDRQDEAFVLGVLSSIPLDWYARRVVETHVNFHLLNGFPIPNPPPSDALRRRVVEIAGRLAAVDGRYADWAAEVGVPVGSVTDPEEKADLIAELDAAVALLYGLDEADVRVIFETFHEGWDHTARLEAVMQHFRRLRA